jgi:hypothetical protein
MRKRTRLVVATATLAALAATGAAPAMAAGTDPNHGVDAPSSDAKSNGGATGTSKTAADADADFAAAAASLGVTTDQLGAAVVAAKTSLATSTSATDDDFVGAVANNLGLPVSQVSEALTPLLVTPSTRAAEKGGEDKAAGADDPQRSPFATDAAAASLAAALGIEPAVAKSTLAALIALGSSGGIEPASQPFRDLATTAGVSPEQLRDALGELKRSLAGS